MPRKTTAPNAGERQKRNARLIIGRRIAHRRAVLGMSQSKLAGKFGVSTSTLAQAEVGIADLNAGDMLFLAQILKVPVTYFFLSEGDQGAKERTEQIVALMPQLPAIQQDMILNTVIDSYCRANIVKQDIQTDDSHVKPKFNSSFLDER